MKYTLVVNEKGVVFLYNEENSLITKFRLTNNKQTNIKVSPCDFWANEQQVEESEASLNIYVVYGRDSVCFYNDEDTFYYKMYFSKEFHTITLSLNGLWFDDYQVEDLPKTFKIGLEV